MNPDKIPHLQAFCLPSVFVIALVILLAAWPGQALAVSPNDPVAGISQISPAQMEAELSSVNPGHIHPNISQLYTDWGYRFGIRADVAFAQMLHETNYLRYGGDVQPWQNNFAGIGATGGVPGNSFATPELGVIAHFAHLAWYVFPDHVNSYCNTTYDPRHFGETHRNTVTSIIDLNGQWAVPGTGYGEAIARIATRFQNYNLQGHWLGSFNELAGTPATELSTDWYFPWYDSRPSSGMAGDWLLIGNQGAGTAHVTLRIGSRLIHDAAHTDVDYWSIPEGGRITPSIYNFAGGPVIIESLDGQPLIASQRVLYRDSFSEVTGIPEEGISDSWEFPWYDSFPEDGMNGDWIIAANSDEQPADVEILIGGSRVALFSAATGNALAPGALLAQYIPHTRGGPVIVRSTNGQQLIASQRVIYHESFNELMGVPTAGLADEYLFTWYDSSRLNGMYGDWLMVANRGSQPAEADIFVGSELKASYRTAYGNAVPVGGIVTPVFPDITDGPVRVVSTNGQNLLVSQRVLFKDSFEEVPGVTQAQVSDEQLFTWYDATLVNYMRGDWVLVSNQGAGDAEVAIYIGDIRMNDPGNPANDYFLVPQGGMITPNFPNIMGGPVRVVSLTGQPLLTSQRVLYKDGMIR